MGHIEDFFDDDNFLCKNCKEHSVAESMEISTESDNNEIGQDDNEDVFETVEVIAEYESETNMHEGEDITDILDIEVPVVAIEPNSISLTLGDESFSLPKSQKVRMTAARQMAINASPDKLEIPVNYPGDNQLEITENFSQHFQSDVDVDAIESISRDHNLMKPVARSQPIVNTNRNIIVHEENASTGPTLKSFLEEISLGHLLTMFQDEDVTIH